MHETVILRDLYGLTAEHALDGEGKTRVAIDPRYFRPTEVESLFGDATKARTKLGWQPKASFADLVNELTRWS